MPLLNVPGAALDYVTKGSGPNLLLIPGAPGAYSIFEGLIDAASSHYTVTTYSRRGFSGSVLDGAQDYAHRLETDADDAAAMISHLSPTQPVFVFGTSAGAVVAQTLLLRHPEKVRKVVAHEPPSVRTLPQPFADQAIAGFQNLYDLYRAQGAEVAIATFASMLAPLEGAAGARFFDVKGSADVKADITYWFERELLVYPSASVDVEGLAQLKDKYTPCLGEASVEHLSGGPIQAIAGQLQLTPLKTPGGHAGYVTQPKEFVEKLLTVLS